VKGARDSVNVAGAWRVDSRNGSPGVLSNPISVAPAKETGLSLGTALASTKSDDDGVDFGETGMNSREPSADSKFKGLDFRSQEESSCVRTAVLLGCDLKRLHAVVLGDGPVCDGDTHALILGVEHVRVPRIIAGGRRADGVRLSVVARNLRMDHWTQCTRSASLVRDECSFNNTSNRMEKHRQVITTGLIADRDTDLQSALEELSERFARLAKVRTDPKLSEFTRQLCAASSGSIGGTLRHRKRSSV
jgi:hypothetical protein